MLKKIAVVLFALMMLQGAVAAEKVAFEMNQVTIDVKDNGVEISWFCQEPNMEYVKKFYSKPRWNVFAGAHQLTTGINKCSAAVTLVDGCISLYERLYTSVIDTQ